MTNSVPALWITALASLGAFACSAGDVGDPASGSLSGEETTTLAQDLRGADPASYLLLRRDVRRCAAPACGGFFVDPVNSDTLRCADGQRSEECYVADLDLSALGLSPAQEASLRSDPTTFLVQGELRSRGARSTLADLSVSEAWHGHADTTPGGQFLRARNDGIVCITTPCLSFSAELLNRQEPAFSVAEIDLSRVTQDTSAGLEQLNAPDGLLLAARRTTVRGQGGSARGLRASEFYVPFVAEPQSCGSRGQSQCADGSFCNFPVAAACGSFDAPGVCEPSPQVCFEIFAPVCGCDGETYANSCFAAAAGVSVSATGECEPPPQLCGSRGLPRCDAGSFCSFPPESNCGRADAPGACAVRPEACIQLFKPVCGCDGKTYGNSCNAASAGVSVAFDGSCRAPRP
jgi:Kazal-type serine protease inhibitor domain